MTDKIPKNVYNLAFPSLNASFPHNFGIEKSAKTHENSPQDVTCQNFLSPTSRAWDFHTPAVMINDCAFPGLKVIKLLFMLT